MLNLCRRNKIIESIFSQEPTKLSDGPATAATAKVSALIQALKRRFSFLLIYSCTTRVSRALREILFNLHPMTPGRFE